MHIQKRKLKSGDRYYLRYWKNKKNICVPRKVIEDDPNFSGKYPFETREATEFFIKKSFTLTEYKNHTAGLLYLKNKKKYFDLDQMTQEFFEDTKETAPRSYESTQLYFARYVLPYFIFNKKELNIAKWHLFFKEYRNWLRYEARTKSDYSQPRLVNEKNPLLSFSSKNHCIRALNGFLKSMIERNYLSPASSLKCKSFERHLVDENARTYEDIIHEQEFFDIKAKLNESHDLFTIAYHTGMRFNEIYSLSIEDLFFEENVEEGIEDWMKEALKAFGYHIYGYITLKSQMDCKTRQRDENGHVPRKPLKGRKTMDLKDGRIIPIMDEETMNILIKLYNNCVPSYQSKIFGKNKENYFLIPHGVNEIRRDFLKHCKKGTHACRHSFISNLVGKTRNQILTRTITGHRSLSAFDRYVHIYQSYMIQATIDREVKVREIFPKVKEVS